MKRFLLLTMLLLPALASADEAVDDARSGFSIGGRGMYSKPKDADQGRWHGGGQVRLHLGKPVALEGSADYRTNGFDGSEVDVVPVQASLLLFLTPEWRLSPYLLGGGGWYYTKVRGLNFDRTQHRFGPHAGGGLSLVLNRYWSIDGSYRYVWLSRFRTQDAAHPLGRDLDDSGYMATAGLNLHF